MSNKNDHDIYIIPPNFIETGTFFGGMFRARNVIEAGILALAIGTPAFFVPSIWADRPHYCFMPDCAPGGIGCPHWHFRGKSLAVSDHFSEIPAESPRCRR